MGGLVEVLGSVEIVLSTERVRPLMTSLEAAWRDFTDPTENVKKGRKEGSANAGNLGGDRREVDDQEKEKEGEEVGEETGGVMFSMVLYRRSNCAYRSVLLRAAAASVPSGRRLRSLVEKRANTARCTQCLRGSRPT